MSTTPMESFAVHLATLGPVYPFVDTEKRPVLVALVIWIAFRALRSASRNAASRRDEPPAMLWPGCVLPLSYLLRPETFESLVMATTFNSFGKSTKFCWCLSAMQSALITLRSDASQPLACATAASRRPRRVACLRWNWCNCSSLSRRVQG